MPRRAAPIFLPYLAALFAGIALFAASPSYAQNVALRVAGTAFGEPAAIEVRNVDRESGAGALDSAWNALVAAEAELRRFQEQGAGQPTSPSPEVVSLLVRTQGFCRWSDGATSALGAPIYKLWSPLAAALPTTAGLASATDATRCDRLAIDEAGGRIDLLPGSGFDLRSFARGWAIDRAADLLKGLGASDFWIEVGNVARAAGPGPGGRGWPYPLPGFGRADAPLGTLLLRDQSVAIADPAEKPVRIAGESFSRYVDLHTGRPSSGVAGVVAVSTLAVDAEPLATAMAVFGANAGQMRLGTLKPKPSVLWLLGTPESGAPVLATANWSSVKKR